MPGPASYARDVDVAAMARDQLDQAAGLVEDMEAATRRVLAVLIDLWPDSAWLAAGASSAVAWMKAYTPLSYTEAKRLERITELCLRDPLLRTAVLDGRLSLGRAHQLAKAVTPERARFLTPELIAALLEVADTADDDFTDALRYWTARVDEHLQVRRVQPHSIILSERLFGGGDIHGSLTPSAFANLRAAIDAFTQSPDPHDAPHQRTLSERRADGLDDLAHYALTHHCDDDTVCTPGPETDADRADDVFDGTSTEDDLDRELAAAAEEEDLDPLDAMRLRLRHQLDQQARRARRQTKARSGVCVNVHVDLATLAETRDVDDLGGLVFRGEGWNLTRRAAERLLCDTTLVVTLFNGRTRILDANEAAERFSKAQRRAIAARDHHCVFPSCSRRPRHCDTHHLRFREHGGPTTTGNGCLLCRFHHRLVHEHGWTLTTIDDHWIAIDPHGVEWKGRPTNPAAA